MISDIFVRSTINFQTVVSLLGRRPEDVFSIRDGFVYRCRATWMEKTAPGLWPVWTYCDFWLCRGWPWSWEHVVSVYKTGRVHTTGLQTDGVLPQAIDEARGLRDTSDTVRKGRHPVAVVPAFRRSAGSRLTQSSRRRHLWSGLRAAHEQWLFGHRPDDHS